MKNMLSTPTLTLEFNYLSLFPRMMELKSQRIRYVYRLEESVSDIGALMLVRLLGG